MLGSVLELGGWDVTKAMLLATDRDRYPVWSGQFEIAYTDNSLLEYKYIKLTTEESG